MGIMGLTTNRSFYRAKRTDPDYQPRSEKELRTAAPVREAGRGGTKSAEARRVNRELLGDLVSKTVPNWASIGVSEALEQVRDKAPAQKRFIDRLLAMPAADVQKILGLEAGAKKVTTNPDQINIVSKGQLDHLALQRLKRGTEYQLRVDSQDLGVVKFEYSDSSSRSNWNSATQTMERTWFTFLELKDTTDSHRWSLELDDKTSVSFTPVEAKATTAPSRAGSSSSGLRTQIPVATEYPPGAGHKQFTREFLSELQPGEYTLNNGQRGSYEVSVTSASAERVHFIYNGSHDSFDPYDFAIGAHFVRK